MTEYERTLENGKYEVRIVQEGYGQGYFVIVDKETGVWWGGLWNGEREAMHQCVLLNRPKEKLSTKDAWELMYS